LAEPNILGITGGASLGAVVFIVVGSALLPAAWMAHSAWMLPVFAFFGALLVTVLVYSLARTVSAGSDVATLLLAGVAVTALAFAAIGYFIFIATEAQVRSITFWSMGSLVSCTWEMTGILALVGVPPLVWLGFQAKAFNLLALGEPEARHLGVRVEHLKRLVMVTVALAVGACVAFVGVIGFVGLVVPHVLRLWLGPDHTRTRWPALLLGACLVLASDVVARTVAAPAELPIGVVTATVGAPFFLWLLTRNRTR
jgi:iron complex transport system permease protein